MRKYIETWYDNGTKQLLGSDGTSVLKEDAGDKAIDNAIKNHESQIKNLVGIKPFLAGHVVLKVVDRTGKLLKEHKFEVSEKAAKGTNVETVLQKEKSYYVGRPFKKNKVYAQKEAYVDDRGKIHYQERYSDKASDFKEGFMGWGVTERAIVISQEDFDKIKGDAIEIYKTGGGVKHKHVHVDKGFRQPKGYDVIKGADKKKDYSKGAKHVSVDKGYREPHGYKAVKGSDKTKKYDKGGFVGKGELVWSKLSAADKAKFLHENFTPEITPRSQELLVGKAYKFLPKNVKIKVDAKYANVEEYAKGANVGDDMTERDLNEWWKSLDGDLQDTLTEADENPDFGWDEYNLQLKREAYNYWDKSLRSQYNKGGGVGNEKYASLWYAIAEKGKHWSDLSQKELTNLTWNDAVKKAKEIAADNKSEVRLSKSKGYNNQGYYFHYQSLKNGGEIKNSHKVDWTCGVDYWFTNNMF